MFSKNEFYKTKARINSFKKDYGGNVIVKTDDDFQSPQIDFDYKEVEAAAAITENRFISTAEKTWKEEMKAGKLNFEQPLGKEKVPKIFKDEDEVSVDQKQPQKQQRERPETPTKKKKRFCCCF